MLPAVPGRALSAVLCVVGLALAPAAAHSQGRQGRPAAANEKVAADVTIDVGQINPAFTYQSASFGTGAVGLRNRRDGGINISGVSAPIKRAMAYWAVITDGPPTPTASNIYLKRGAANGPFTNIHGTPIGTGPSPCWDGDRTTVYRGAIPLSLASGNGLYLVTLRPGANASTGGQSPWEISAPPMFEGVSIVLIGTGSSTVSVYDARFAGKMFHGRLTYRLKSPVNVKTADQVTIHSIGADGQSGVGVEAIASTAGEVTTLYGKRIAGPGSPAGGGDWNGSVAAPLPQLWDNNTHDVTAAAHAGGNPLILPFVIDAPDDCVVSVANILSVTGAQ